MKKSIPVKVCEYCYSQNNINTSGFTSVRMDNAWFCHKYCHNLALLAVGEIDHANNTTYYKSLLESRIKIFPEWKELRNGEVFTVSKITKNKQRLRDDKRRGQIRIVKQIHEFTEEPEDNL